MSRYNLDEAPAVIFTTSGRKIGEFKTKKEYYDALKETKKRSRRTNAQIWADEEAKIPMGFCENCSSCLSHRCKRYNRRVEYGYNRCILFTPKVVNITAENVIILYKEGKNVS